MVDDIAKSETGHIKRQQQRTPAQQIRQDAAHEMPQRTHLEAKKADCHEDGKCRQQDADGFHVQVQAVLR